MPVVGEIRRARDVDMPGYRYKKVIWQACEECGNLRWVILRNGLPSTKCCLACNHKIRQPQRLLARAASREQRLADTGIPGTRRCSKCDEVLALDRFPTRNGRPLQVCRACSTARTAAWRDTHPDSSRESAARGRRERPNVERRAYLKYRYGMSLEQYEAMGLAQGGACAICEGVPTEAFHVDHCHDRDVVRGLLCARCNQMLGFARDDAEILEKAAKYLRATA